MTRTVQRSISAGLVLAMALALLVAAPRPASAHAGCGTSQGSGGAFQSVLAAVNIFASFLPSAETCDDKFAGVQVKMEQDFSVDVQGVASNANPSGNAPTAFAPCINGKAAGLFECDGIDMLGYVSHAELGTTFVNDIWGWTDPQTKQDFALVGASEGTVFVDISDPKRPVVQGILPTATTAGGDFWRDIKVYDDHAFVVSENTGHGLQVFDLTRLRDWDGTYTTYDVDARYTGHGSAHNLNINTETGFAYSVGAGQSSECGTGLHMIDINDPTSPRFAGCFDGHGYVHDTQCVVYEGADAEHVGKEICFNSTPSGPESVSVVDVTDKENPQPLSDTSYANGGYSHQGWLTPDQGFFLHGDELDELFGRVATTTTRTWDMSDLDAPELIEVWTNGESSIDHNIYTEDRYAYASNYTTGLRVLDTRGLASGNLQEVGYFDVYPENDNASFEGGTWSNYPYFRQKGVVAVSSIDRGLFILQPRVGR